MFPGFHGFDLIIVLAIALLFIGPKKLPEIGSAIGKTIQEYRKSMKELAAPDDEEVQALSAPDGEVVAQDAPATSTPQTRT